MLKQKTLRILFWLAAGTSIVLLMLPGGVFGDVSFGRLDLLVHLTMMAGVAALGVMAYGRYRLPMILGLGTAAIGSEILQIFVPGRYFDLTDLAANCLGIAVGYLVGLLLTPLARKREPLAINR